VCPTPKSVVGLWQYPIELIPLFLAFTAPSIIMSRFIPRKDLSFCRNVISFPGTSSDSCGLSSFSYFLEVFYSTHQSFLTHQGIYVLVINGSLNLDSEIPSESFIPGRHGI
jgi:hypothetical protein